MKSTTVKFAIAMFAGIAAFAEAATTDYVWTGGAGNGLWADANNWQSQVKPVSSSTDTVIYLSDEGITLGEDGYAEINGAPTLAFNRLIFTNVRPLRVTGGVLTIGLYCAYSTWPTEANSAIVCNSTSPVDLACNLYSTGQRAIWLGVGADLTLSGTVTAQVNGSATFLQKYGPVNSRFSLAGEFSFSGLSGTAYDGTWADNATICMRGGTNVIASAAVSKISKSGTRIVFGSNQAETIDTFVFFGAGTYESEFVTHNLGSGRYFKMYFDGACTFKEDFRSLRAAGNYSLISTEGSDITFEKDLIFPGVKTYFNLGQGTDLTVGGHFETMELWDFDRVSTDMTVANFHLNGTAAATQIYTRYYNIIFGQDNVFTNRPLFTWGSYSSDVRGVYDMNGHDQTIGGINCVLGSSPSGGRLIKSDTPATLTIEDTADRVAKSFIKGPVSVVYNPAEFHRLTLSNSTYAATGDLVISNGTIRLVTGASYPNANEIRICPGAAFELETTASLKNVGKITVEAGGTFRFLSSLASPFDVGLVEFNVESGATIEVAGEVSIMALNLKIDGVRPDCGRYQALDGTDATATKVAWISGAGVLGLNVGYTRWKNAADGIWGEVAKWDDGLPDADTGAMIDAEGASYTVSVDANPGIQTNIIIRNSGFYTTTVNVTAPMTIADGVLQLLNGARFRIGAGGSVLHNHDDPDVYTFTEATSSKIRVSAGTELSLESGGSFKATNFVGRLIVEGAEGNPARIKVDSGNFSFHTAGSVNPRMILGPYSELFVTNTGSFHIDSTKDGSKYPPFYQAGGTIDLSGDSRFLVGRTKARPFGTGMTTFRGNALLTVDEGLFDQKYYPDIYIGPSYNCETSTVVFSDHAKFYTTKFAALTSFRVGDDSPLTDENAITNGLAVLRYDSDSYSRFGSYFTVGSDYCRGELYLNSGSMSVTYGSLEVGGGNSTYRRDRNDAHGEGLMVVNGGTFDVRALNGHIDSIIQGLIVGAGWESKLDGNSFYRGRLELNSGTVRSNKDAANVIVGAGRAKGEIVQNGGTFAHLRAERKFAMAIGFSGGDGSYVITGGTATVNSDLYVGGVLPSTFNYTLAYCPNNHDATGLLSVRGGTFSVVSNLVLSADGAGTLEIGGAGLLTVGGDLVLSNGTETASVATLKYTFGSSGVGSLSVGGDIVIASGSRLVVDMSQYTGQIKSFRLLDLSSAEGTFSDIEFIKPSIEGGDKLTLDVDADGIRVRTNHKTLILLY